MATLPDIELVAEKVHESWMASKRQQGYSSWKPEDEELMVPYAQLSEKAKDLDRNTVKAVYAAIGQTSSPVPEGIDHEAEKEVMMKAFAEVHKMFEMRSWIMEGRGSYRYDDDRYKEEVRYLFDEFDTLYKDTWANIKSKSFEFRKKVIADYFKENPQPMPLSIIEELDAYYNSHTWASAKHLHEFIIPKLRELLQSQPIIIETTNASAAELCNHLEETNPYKEDGAHGENIWQSIWNKCIKEVRKQLQDKIVTSSISLSDVWDACTTAHAETLKLSDSSVIQLKKAKAKYLKEKFNIILSTQTDKEVKP